MTEVLSVSDIIRMYKEGRRDFSNASANSQDFTNADLKGIIFRNAKLTFATFDGCQLQGADFSGADLSWAGFDRADLREAKFTGANCQYALFDNATVDRADFRNADFSWGRLLNVNFQAADTRGASFLMAAFTMADMSKESLTQVQFELSSLKSKIPYELWLKTKLLASGTIDKITAMNMIDEKESSVAGYRISAGGNYRLASEASHGVTAYSTGTMTDSYRAINPYRSERKPSPLF